MQITVALEDITYINDQLNNYLATKNFPQLLKVKFIGPTQDLSRTEAYIHETLYNAMVTLGCHHYCNSVYTAHTISGGKLVHSYPVEAEKNLMKYYSCNWGEFEPHYSKYCELKKSGMTLDVEVITC